MISQAVLGSLEVPELGMALLPNEARRFWCEHSDRAGTDSWVAAPGIPETERNFLGRWKVKGSMGAYVRTALLVVENVQTKVASAARQSLHNGPGYLGESKS